MRGRIRLQSVLRFGLFWRSFAKGQKGIADPEAVGEMVLARIGTRTRFPIKRTEFVDASIGLAADSYKPIEEGIKWPTPP